MPAFRDRGRQLVATRSDPAAIRDMVAIAQHRGWSAVRVSGAPGFRRQAWLLGRLQGLEVTGYEPTERDLRALDRRRSAERPQREAAPERKGTLSQQRRKVAQDLAASRLRTVEAVVQGRVRDPADQARIMGLARRRLAELLERSASPPPPRSGRIHERHR